MVTTAICKAESIERFKSLDSTAICAKPEPRVVYNKFVLEMTTPSKPFLAMGRRGIIIDTTKADLLVKQARSLRKKHFWFFWRMYAPYRRVIDSTELVIRYCPSDLFLEGYQVLNYGNGTVALMRRSKNYSITINIGACSLTYAKLRLSDHKVVNSGECPIEKAAVEQLFEIL